MKPRQILTFTEKGGGPPKPLFLYEAENVFPLKDFPLFITKGGPEPAMVPEHKHDFVEIVFVSRGRGTHQIKKLSRSGVVGETFSHGILQGDIFFLPPGDIHAYTGNENLVIYNVLFLPELLGPEIHGLKKLPGLAELFSPLRRGKNSGGERRKIHLPFNSRTIVEALLNKIVEELGFQKSGFKIIAKSAFLEFLVFIGRMEPNEWKHSVNIRDAQNQYSSIYKAVILMEERLAEPLELKDLAARAGLSPTYFCEQFKAVTGLSPWGYLTTLRLEKAKALLSSSSDSISETAFKCGFCDNSYFAKIFKAREGTSPRQFRARISGKKT